MRHACDAIGSHWEGTMEIPTLETGRLLPRPFTPADAPDVGLLAGAFAVADTTLNIPPPYPEGAAEAWIAGHRSFFASGAGANWAIIHRHDGALLGAISCAVTAAHSRAELGYW